MVTQHVLIYYSASHLSYQINSAVNLYYGNLQFLKKLIVISLKINLFSPWYSWKIAELALNNHHSLTIKTKVLLLQAYATFVQFLAVMFRFFGFLLPKTIELFGFEIFWLCRIFQKRAVRTTTKLHFYVCIPQIGPMTKNRQCVTMF